MAIYFSEKCIFLFCIVILQFVLFVNAKLPNVCDQYYGKKHVLESAHVNITNKYHSDIVVLLQSENCYMCKLIPSTMIKTGNVCRVAVDTRWPVRLEIRRVVNGKIQEAMPSCREKCLSQKFLEAGEYKMSVNSTLQCERPILLNDPPRNVYALYLAIAFLIIVPFYWLLIRYLYRKGIFHRIFHIQRDDVVVIGSLTNFDCKDKLAAPKTERLRSIDSFRGFALTLMNFVNHGGGCYWYFKSASWNGIAGSDLVMPGFTFIMGTSIMFWLSSQLKKKTSKKRLFYKICRRSIKLFIIGLIVNTGGHPNGVPLKEIRIPGVLQRVSVTYFMIASIHMFFARQTLANKHLYQWWSPMRDVFPYWVEWTLNLLLVVLWLCLTFFLPVPNCPTGYLGPGGIGDEGNYPNCTGGAANYIDAILLGHRHLMQKPTPVEIYHSNVPHDPEGILGTLTCCLMCFFGLQIGKILIIFKTWQQRVIRFISWAILLGIIGTALCGGKIDGGFIPINKNMWSLSFVFIMSSFGFILFTIIYLLIDVLKVWKGAPFYHQGLNTLVVYVGHVLVRRRFPFYFEVDNTHYWHIVISIWAMCLWFFIAMFMDKKRVYVTV